MARCLCTVGLWVPIILKRCLGDETRDTQGTLPPGKTIALEQLVATYYTSFHKGRGRARKEH